MEKCHMKPPHYVWVAIRSDEPGAFAACIDEDGYEEHWQEWAKEVTRDRASTIRKVTCDEAHAMLKEYSRWCDEQDLSTAAEEQGAPNGRR
jgi:hypothetical protein